MTTFDDRERAFENKFQHDQDLLFRIRARRDRLAGLWAADLMGLHGGEADAYARELVETDFGAGPQDLRTRLVGDLQGKGIDVSAHRVEKELENLLRIAHDQVVRE